MTPGVGLNTWKYVGSLNRELKPYVEYVKKGWKVKILTFDKDDIPELPEGIEAISFQDYRLLFFLPWKHRELGSWADVIKTNQSVHAYFYTFAAKLWKKPILLRCGYVQGEYLETTRGLTPKVRLYQLVEAKAFRQATHCQVPTKELAQWVQRKYRVPEQKISVVPNFVDTEIFRPMPEVNKIDKSVISVGRLVPVKQFDLLIKACANITGCTLTIIGEGPERKNLENLARLLKVNLNLLGNIPNEELPKILNQHQVFAITSKWEGHPKALIEAMACGLPCLAVKSAGIENLIDHGTNGWIVISNSSVISQGLSLLLKDVNLDEYLSKNAQRFVKENYDFFKIMNSELSICDGMINYVF